MTENISDVGTYIVNSEKLMILLDSRNTLITKLNTLDKEIKCEFKSYATTKELALYILPYYIEIFGKFKSDELDINITKTTITISFARNNICESKENICKMLINELLQPFYDNITDDRDGEDSMIFYLA